MSEAKKAILEKIRNALGEVPRQERPEDITVPRHYRQQGNRAAGEVVALFAGRVGEYKATVQRVNANALAGVIAESCRREGVEKLVVPDGFPGEWLPGDEDDNVRLLHDKPGEPLSHRALDDSDGVITTCALGVAQTGTIILDAGAGQGRRVLTLLPDYHLCIVKEEQIVELVSEGFTHFEQAVREEGPPITFISGPSATSDIELSRVEGVHGPRRLEVLIVQE
ncbi:L-lactate dehydrogenase complex protein LldG [Fodinibius roseus]|uniref:L-lactate dehydrogenase complex protein LldG n=1 Tax=Fodinibius roseus TaxID=1194090 RepID=A0A1M5KYJ9_9BACT|nr:lactate utilization protein C [Fodinibius roseus]SHG57233.1 L-lactate dehydrogenase complex protein LldG [Fodinibius roseus]